MAKNDTVLLDGIIDQRMSDSTAAVTERGEVFELLALGEMLKDFDLSDEELDHGWIDGSGDGGIDGFYVLVNGHLLEDVEDFFWPRSDASIEVWLITCKHHDTFQQAPLDAILATIQELFDFSIDNSDLQGSYSDELMGARTAFHYAYRRLSIQGPALHFQIAYASRGDSNKIGDSVAARASQIERTLTSLFSSCSTQFSFVGATELVSLHRQSRRFTLDLPFVEHLATGKQSYVLLVRLEDYWRFVSEDGGALRRYLFDSNVRDFLGGSPVNEEIARSLADPSGPDFWWLNNGVTILATSATIPGKTIQLQDIQIVNGLQTTETIHRHFQNGNPASKNRSLLVKIIVTSDAHDRDRIIRATNNQSPVDLAALHATDKIQRDIEEILARNNWYYERRRNYYLNIGKPPERFVTPIYLASAVVALILKNPSKATRLKSRFMRSQVGYDSVFSAGMPIAIWPVLTNIYKQLDTEIPKALSSSKSGERFLGAWRPLLALIVVARRLMTFSYSLAQLAAISGAAITESEVAEAWNLVDKVSNGRKHGKKLKAGFILECCDAAGKAFGILGANDVGRRTIATPVGPAELLPDDFLAMVDAILPSQPWPPGTHIEVAAKLDSRPMRVSRAIQQLISSGRRLRQFNGIAYNIDGSVYAVDAARVSQSAEELNSAGHRFAEPND